MKLTNEEIKRSSLGCVEIVQGGVWQFARMPAVMRGLYESIDRLRVRMECPSCVRIRFATNARAVRLALRYGEESRPFYKCGIVVDGKTGRPFGPEARRERWEGTAFEQPRRRTRVLDIWLPHQVRTDVEFIEVEKGASVTAAPKPSVKWLAYGDSITQGMTAAVPTSTAAARCALALDAEVFNVAIGGAALDKRLAETVPDTDWDVVSIAYGTNDHNQGIRAKDFGASAVSLVNALQMKRPDKPVVLITPLTRAGGQGEKNKNGETLDDFRRCLMEAAAGRKNVHLVPGTELIADDPKWFVDNVHPNDEGFGCYAARLLKTLEAVIKR